MNYHFKGSLDDDQYDILPQSLVALVQMILGGSNMQNQSENCNNIRGAVSSLTQLLVFNTMKRPRNGSLGSHHNFVHEILLPLYLGNFFHGKTRKSGNLWMYSSTMENQCRMITSLNCLPTLKMHHRLV